MTTDEIQTFIQSIISRAADAQKALAAKPSSDILATETTATLVREADSAVDDLAAWLEENL